MSAFDGADAAPRSQLPGSCSFEPVTKAEKAPLSSSVFWVRCGAGVAQSVPPWLTRVSPSPPSKLLGLIVVAAEALTAAIAKSAHAARRAAKSAHAIEIREVMAIPCVRWRTSGPSLLCCSVRGGTDLPSSSLSPCPRVGYGPRGSFRVDVSQRAARRPVRMHNRSMARSRTPRAALLGLLALGAAGGIAHAAGTPDGAKKVSNETTLSRYANPNDSGPIRTSPDSGAHVIARLKLNTEDRLPNNYIVLRSWTDPHGGAVWYQLRIPGRPNGRLGWVRSESLGPLQTVRTQLIVNRHTLRATLYRNGRRVFRAPVGVG